VSRSQQRARGWGIPVPDDPSQVIYVWWDALGNYVSALDFGGTAEAYRDWWLGADRRVHLVGKGVLRFHAIYWPAMLLSAGAPLPTDILVHDHLTVAGQKISKSGTSVDPVGLTTQFGTDAVRWWLLRDVPRAGDADFTAGRLVARADDELAGGIGNLVNRVVTMVHRYRDGRPPPAASATVPTDAENLTGTVARAPAAIEAALAGYDFRRATAPVLAIVEAANRYVERAAPWHLARAERTDASAGARLDAVLAVLLGAVDAVSGELGPFLPDGAARIGAQCTPIAGRLPQPRPVFVRLG
jgi:methionyl-tRNA synthetase